MNSKTTVTGFIIASLTMALAIMPTILSTNVFAQAGEDRAADKNPQKSNPVTTTTVGPLEPVTNPKGQTTGFTQKTTTTTESCTTRGGQTASGLEPQDGGCRGSQANNENTPEFERTVTVDCQAFNKEGKPTGKKC
jgi:hypothetical protein